MVKTGSPNCHSGADIGVARTAVPPASLEDVGQILQERGIGGLRA
jgi:hypothetical protein